jgi:uncharacterized protein YndB with AHSA1/START domain
MRRIATFHAVRVAEAPPAVVWSVLADYPGMTRWAGARSVTIEQPGTVEPNGVGTIRVLKSWRGTIREEITEFEPPRRMGYTALSGLPVDNYNGAIELIPNNGSTQISWTVTFEPRTFAAPVVAAVIKSVLKVLVGRLVKQVSEVQRSDQ